MKCESLDLGRSLHVIENNAFVKLDKCTIIPERWQAERSSAVNLSH